MFFIKYYFHVINKTIFSFQNAFTHIICHILNAISQTECARLLFLTKRGEQSRHRPLALVLIAVSDKVQGKTHIFNSLPSSLYHITP